MAHTCYNARGERLARRDTSDRAFWVLLAILIVLAVAVLVG